MKNIPPIVLFVDFNPRALISVLRCLHYNRLNYKVAVSSKSSLLTKIMFFFYRKNFLYYERESDQLSIGDLLEIKNKIGPYIILPFGENFIRYLFKVSSVLDSESIHFLSPGRKVYEQVSNKEKFLDLCLNNGINIAKKIDSDFVSFSKPFVLKPKEYREGELNSPILIKSDKSFKYFKKRKLDLSKYFAEEYLEGDSYYYLACYKNGEKRVSLSQRNLVQQPGGKSIIKAEPCCLPSSIVFRIDNIFKGLSYNGIMMFELRYETSQQSFYAIECNPRFWGPLQLSMDNGVNFLEALLEVYGYVGDFEKKENENRKKYGYIWVNGWFQGFFLKYLSWSNFQTWPKCSNCSFVDVWFRRDTFVYFFLEPAIVIYSFFRIAVNKLRLLINKK